MVKINKEDLDVASNLEGSRGGKKKEVVSQEEEKYLEDAENCFTYL